MAGPGCIYRAPRAAALTGISTTETVFLNALPSGSTTPNIAYLKGANACDARSIRIVAVGKATGGTTTNLTINIYQGSSATVGSDSLLCTSGAKAVNSASGNFRVNFEGVVDVTSGKLIGLVSGHVNATAVSQAISSAVTSLDPSGADIPFVVSATWSADNASNSVSLTSFQVEVD